MQDTITQEEMRQAAIDAKFDPSIPLAPPQHDLYSKATRALAAQAMLDQAENMLQAAPNNAAWIMLDGVRVKAVLHGDGCPDKPGTVRRPGIRRQFLSNRKQRWATY